MDLEMQFQLLMLRRTRTYNVGTGCILVVGAYYADIRYKNTIPRFLKKVLMEYNSTPCTEWTTWPENISVHLGAHPI
jgi:hypothetical protein